MSEITTERDLISYIRIMLGEPLITVELNDEQISMIIRDTIQMFTEVAYGDVEDSLVLHRSEVLGVNQEAKSIHLPQFSSVISVLPASSGHTSYSESAAFPRTPLAPEAVTFGSFRNCEVIYQWYNIPRKLVIRDKNIPEEMIVVGLTRYSANPDGDYIFNEPWVKDMAKAKTQKLWGQILGKYSNPLVGNAELNYDRIISEADAEIERLMEELQEKWTDPCPVLVG